MYKIKVNDDKDREVIISGDKLTIDGTEVTWDLIDAGSNLFHVIRDNRSYTCEVTQSSTDKKEFEIRINGTPYQVRAKDRFDELLAKLGMGDASTLKVNAIKAPMPGLVLKLLVEEGQEIHKGDSIVILEAMKMENVIKSPGTGKVKSIKVKVKEAVEKNQLLIELD